MKKNLIFSILFSCVSFLCANDVETGHDFAKFAETRVRFLKNSWMVLQRERKMYAHGSWNIVTPAGYYSFAQEKNSFKNVSNGVWEYAASFPADKAKNNQITFRQNIEITPFGLLDCNISWESKNPNGNRGSFYNLVIAMKEIENKEILIGTERFKVQNIQKFGVFNKVFDHVELTFFEWDEKRCFKILCSGKVKVVGSCAKDKNFSIRLYPAAKNAKTFSFSVKVR